MSPPEEPGICPRCAAPLPPDRPEGLCPACLLARAGDSISADGAVDAASTPRLAPGQTFGPYRIEQLLGRGGMGEVYEAEHVAQGRRVALKVLSERFTSADDRARFLREGRLAASLSDPHTVYIFGSEEIDGTPVIAMELLPGGTLKDRVLRDGPMPLGTAIGAIRHVIAGLAAAHAAGILHRDVKPSNCFIAEDGTIKIGDFGLSISTRSNEPGGPPRSTGFAGTPQFAAPEQWRGEALDERSDIFAVGATLYYLLTGRPPFDAPSWSASNGVEPMPPFEAPEWRAVPGPVGGLIRKCLSPDRRDRPQTYEALDDALRPFMPADDRAAALPRRLVAGVVDDVILALALLPAQLHELRLLAFTPRPRTSWLLVVAAAAARVLYFAVLEGRWSASLGKRWLGLRVVRRDGGPIDVRRAAARALLYALPMTLASTPFIVANRLGWDATHSGWVLALGMLPTVWWALLFSTMRRRNGLAALHDLATDTRVVARAASLAALQPAGAAEDVAPPPSDAALIGPFLVIGPVGPTDEGELLMAFDPVLQRRVWVHRPPPGAPALAAARRDASSVTLLHWLTGERGEIDWDAYEAVDGEPLLERIRTPQPWRRMQRWLLDLARTLDVGLRDGSLPPLAVDRLWVTRRDQIKILPFRIGHGGGEHAPTVGPPTESSATALLRYTLDAATAGTHLPLAAATLRRAADAGVFTTAADFAAALSAVHVRCDRVSRSRRLASLACGVGLPVCFGLLAAVAMTVLRPWLTPIMELQAALSHLSELDQQTTPTARTERDALSVYIAGRWESQIRSDAFWTGRGPGATTRFGIPAESVIGSRARAERVVAEHPRVSPADLAAATSALTDWLQASRSEEAWAPAGIGVVVAILFLIPAVFIAPVLGFVCRGGVFLWLLGVAVVTRDGRPAPRWRTCWRALVAWWLVPLACGVGIALVGKDFDHAVGALLTVLVPVLYLTGFIVAVVRPARGLQDRLAGTWLVPR